MSEISSYEKDTRQLLDKLEARIDVNLKRVWEELSDIKEKLIYRLPVWATVGFAFLMAVIGWLTAIIVRK